MTCSIATTRSFGSNWTVFGGQEVKTLGDGFVATFDSPGRAIECALAIKKALGPLDIETRAGLHTGEIEVTGR